jgi:hypothetical protein
MSTLQIPKSCALLAKIFSVQRDFVFLCSCPNEVHPYVCAMQKVLFFGFCLALSMKGFAANTAPAKMHCLSVKIDPAATKVFGNTYRLSITTADSNEPPNGELAVSDSDYDHQGFFAYEDPTLFETFFFPFGLNVPAFIDQNANGLHDFYEVETSIQSVTQGEFLIDPDSGETSRFRATWVRGAGSPDGTVKIELTDLGQTFNHLFHILQYDGTLTYTTENKTIDGQFAFALNGHPEQTLNGAAKITIQTNDKLILPDGAFTTQNSVALHFTTTDALQRDGLIYDTVVVFDDWDPDTSVADYQGWYLQIISPDANNNQIADLVEGQAQPDQPSLSARRTQTGFEVTITGTPGATYEVQITNTVTGGWTADRNVTMTGASETIVLPLDTGSKFIRLKVL